MEKTTYLSGLSIIRALAAISVLLGHFYQFGFWPSDNIKVWLPEIYLPVTTFFVISGFLITWGLLAEKDQTGDVQIGQAYKRRAIRLLPLYYIGIVMGFVTMWCFGKQIEGNVPLLLLLLPNISHVCGSTPFPMWHYWTLGTEFMFYLWFPWIIKYGRKYLLQIVAGICIFWLTLKFGTYALCGKTWLYRFVGVTQFDTIMLGSIGAIFFYNQRKWLLMFCSKKWFAILSWLLFLTSNLWGEILPSPIRAEVIAIISLMVILSGFCGHPILETKTTQYLSKISYAIYIFHPIVIFATAEICTKYAISTHYVWLEYTKVLIVILCTIAISGGCSWLDGQLGQYIKKKKI